MAQQGADRGLAEGVYDTFAPIYDRFNEQNDYETWLGEVLLPMLQEHGLESGSALDVGCGTGAAFRPLIDRGWEVTGCDVSLGMLREAARKHSHDLEQSRLRLEHCDARALPTFKKSFNLVLMLNDVINYLTEDGDLERCFEGFTRNLGPRGLACFDSNSLRLYEQNFTVSGSGEIRNRGWCWTPLATEVGPGRTFEAELSGPQVDAHIHRSRHRPIREIDAALTAAGLESVAIAGQREEDGKILLTADADEQVDQKVIFIARRRQ